MRAGSSKISQPASHQQSRRWSYESIKFIIIIIVKMRHKNIRKDDERRRLQAGDDSSSIWVDKLFVLLHKKKEREAFHAIMPRIAADVWGMGGDQRAKSHKTSSLLCVFFTFLRQFETCENLLTWLVRARATIYAPSRMSYGGDVSQEFALQFIIEVKVASISRHWISIASALKLGKKNHKLISVFPTQLALQLFS